MLYSLAETFSAGISDGTMHKAWDSSSSPYMVNLRIPIAGAILNHVNVNLKYGYGSRYSAVIENCEAIYK